jgi:hypothetical protein
VVVSVVLHLFDGAAGPVDVWVEPGMLVISAQDTDPNDKRGGTRNSLLEWAS